MKEIINWTVVFEDDNGDTGIGLLLPGCIVRGVMLVDSWQVDVEIKVLEVDISNLVITSIQGQQYKLVNASREYLQNINKCIEIGLKAIDGGSR